MGRVFATKKGVEIATGDWLLLLQSNMLVDSSLVLEYCKAIKNRSVVAVGGIADNIIDKVCDKSQSLKVAPWTDSNSEMAESVFDLLNDVKQEDTTDPNSRVLIIDGLNLYLRVFAVNGMLNDRGVPVGGIMGLSFVANDICESPLIPLTRILI